MTPEIHIVREDGLGADNPVFRIDGTSWVLMSGGLDGFSSTPLTVSSNDYAQYDGAALALERSPAVDRTVCARSTFERARARAQAESFFIPGRGYECHVSYMGRKRYCAGRYCALTLPADNPYDDRQDVTFTILCLDPYFYGEAERRFDISQAVPKRGFAYASGADRVPASPGGATGGAPRHVAGFVTGFIRNRVEMVNQGDTTAYPRFDVSATGDVANPVIAVRDRLGAEIGHVGLALTLHDGDTLTIDFSARPTTLELNGGNVSHLVTRGSTLATGIGVGRFSVSWKADSGDAALHVVPTIRERYQTI